jgi:hypothetical protein
VDAWNIRDKLPESLKTAKEWATLDARIPGWPWFSLWPWRFVVLTVSAGRDFP